MNAKKELLVQYSLFHLVLAFSIVMGTAFLAIVIGLAVSDKLDRKRFLNRRPN